MTLRLADVKFDSIAPGTAAKPFRDRLPSEEPARIAIIKNLVKTVQQRVADVTAILERQILSGELSVGDYLPAERTLSEKLGVSRSVVREALVRLPLETTMAALAAMSRTNDHLSRLDATQIILANPRKSLAAHVKADVAFHSILAEATGNRFLPLMLTPIQDLLIESRLQTLRRYGAALAEFIISRTVSATHEDASGGVEVRAMHTPLQNGSARI